MITSLSSLHDIADHYDTFIFDLWGVLHDGGRLFPRAKDCLNGLKQAGKTIILLSNSPRRSQDTANHLANMGINPSLYDAIITSGEVVFQHLQQRTHPFYQNLGRYIYPMDDHLYGSAWQQLSFELTPDIQQASAILCTIWTIDQHVDYTEEMKIAAAQNIPMICVNPDLRVLHQGQVGYCPGWFAQQYQQMGGYVIYHGKPHPEVYEMCQNIADQHQHQRIIAVGDSIHTDITGAKNAGFDSILVASGLHAIDMIPNQRHAFFENLSIKPTFWIQEVQ